jgi:hypothetical protein
MDLSRPSFYLFNRILPNNKNMSQIPFKNLSVFSTRKISADQAVRVLGRNGIRVGKEEAEVILDFLYLIARTYNKQRRLDRPVSWNLRKNRTPLTGLFPNGRSRQCPK